jgi:hypothetical protein
METGMVAKLLRGLKRSFGDYRWFLYYLQRDLTMNPAHRDKVAALIAWWLPKGSIATPCDKAKAIAEKLKRDGIVTADAIITRQEIDDILEYLKTRNCYDPRHPEMPGFSDPHKADRTCFHAYYPDDDVVGAPHLMRIANDPVILGALELVFGGKPTIVSALIWWLFASYDYSDKEREQFLWNTSNMHRDIDDWLQIKLFIYLTDVGDHSAPHMFLERSHRGGPGTGQRVISMEDVHNACPEKMTTITGKAGTTWLENPFGFHVAKRPETGNRLIAAISYSLLPSPFTIGRASIAAVDSRKFDAYINRLWMSPSDESQKKAA